MVDRCDDLFAAVRSSDAYLVRELVLHGALLESREAETRMTALELACTLSDYRMIKLLVSAGASVQPGPQGYPSALELAEERAEHHARYPHWEHWFDRLMDFITQGRTRAGRSRAIVAFLRARGAVAVNPELRPTLAHPPSDWNSAADWDAYFRHRLLQIFANYHVPRHHADELSAYQGLVLRAQTLYDDLLPLGDLLFARDIWDEPAGQRFLLIGNGISFLPLILAHRGHQVVALDLSGVATGFLLAQLGQPLARRYVETRLAQTAALFDEPPTLETSTGVGGIDCVHGDLRDRLLAPGPFDWVVTHRSLQGYDGNDLTNMLQALDARTGPQSCVKFATQNANEIFADIKARFLAMGYNSGTGKVLEAGIFSG